MFPELLTFPPNVRVMQNLFLASLIPKLRGCICMILVCTKHFTEFYNSHGGLTEIVPFTNNKNKYFIVQMVANRMVDVNSKQGKSVI